MSEKRGDVPKLIRTFCTTSLAALLFLNLTSCALGSAAGGEISSEYLAFPEGEDSGVDLQTDKAFSQDGEVSVRVAEASMGESDVSEETDDGLPSVYGVPVDFDRSGLPEAYADAIEAFCFDGTKPDGEKREEIPYGLVSYAIFDVDGDGRDELILQYADTYVAAMTEQIYDYDEETDTFRLQFLEFPFMTYYDNSAIAAKWSHNQGLADGDVLWPYTLYRYRPDSDDYEEIAAVDGWSKSLAESSSWLGGDFPSDVDIDGNGFVYFILDDNGSYTNPIDDADYEAWLKTYLDGASPLEIPYVDVHVELVHTNAAG